MMHPDVSKVLDTSSIHYWIHIHKNYLRPISTPSDFAAILGYDVKRILKTLLWRDLIKEDFCMTVLSVGDRVDTLVLAQERKWRGAKLATESELRRETGFPPNGVSPIAAREIPVLIDASTTFFPTVLVGAGEIGIEVELEPTILTEITQATVVALKE